MTICMFNSLKERDMDLMLLETLASDKQFARLLVDEIAYLKGKDYEVESIELSNYDSDLGESDVTVILKIDGKKYGFLIEDKINAVAMPNQYARYVERGEKAKEKGIYSDYFTFIFCPNKYRNGNAEAKLYTHHLSYERCLDYFKKGDDEMSRFRVQQLEQAIRKSKSSDIVINANANSFFKSYSEYKDAYFPNLQLTTKTDKNGYWPQYATSFKNAYILHKLNLGYVDLYLNCPCKQRQAVEHMSSWLNAHGCNTKAIIQKNVKSACLRYEVSPIDIKKVLFNDVPEAEVHKWFEAIQSLTDIASLFDDIRITFFDAN